MLASVVVKEDVAFFMLHSDHSLLQPAVAFDMGAVWRQIQPRGEAAGHCLEHQRIPRAPQVDDLTVGLGDALQWREGISSAPEFPEQCSFAACQLWRRCQTSACGGWCRRCLHSQAYAASRLAG